MPGQSRTIPLGNWRGLNERKIIGINPEETSSLDNVVIRNGTIKGRLGMAKFDSISTAETDTPIIGLMDFYRAATGASSLLRMSPTKVKVWNSSTHAWDDVTGTALTGSSTTRPQFVSIGESDFLAFTNEGEDRPRKYTGSGNTAQLGGTPPFAKAISFYVGFGVLGNISSDGSTFSPLDVILSDDPDGTWEDCSGMGIYVTTLTLNESPGEVRAFGVIGKSLFAYKSDAIVQIQFTGGPTRFTRNKMAFPLGILAPLSRQPIGEMGEIFLATDRNLYLNTGSQVSPLPNKVQKSLQEVLPASKAPYCRSMVDYSTETYLLGYQRSGSTYLDGILAYNYRTQEFTRSVYPVEFNSMLAFRSAANVDYVRLASSSTLTYQLESGADDDGTAPSRYFDLDWSQFGSTGNKWLMGGQFVFKKQRDCRVRISVGVDKSSKLTYPKTFTLQGRDPDETEVRVDYRLPSPVFGSWFRFRVEFYQDSTSQAELLEIEPEIIPLTRSSEDSAKYPGPLTVK